MRFRLARILSILAILTLGRVEVHAAVKVLRINPQQTDPAIESVHGPHVALYDPQVKSSHRLLVFLSGTHGKAVGTLTIDKAFAKWGYHAIGLDYEDNVVAVTCAHSNDSNCFDHYRDAIVTGDPVSDKISLNRANSILNRLQKLLLYLVQQDPDGGWEEFIADGKPDWNRIVVAGHSQGSGHAAYIGKLFQVDKVLMFSGPQDYLDDLREPAPWLSRPSATPSTRYFAFLNKNDPFNVHHQIANCKALMRTKRPKTLKVEPEQAIQGNYRILINDEHRNPHASTMFPEFENVWEYMATAGVE